MFDEEEDNRHLPLICKLFYNFGFKVNEFNNNELNKSLF